MSKAARYLLLSLSVLAVLLAASPAVAWDNTYGVRDDATSFSSAESLVVDDLGNLYVAGWFWGEFEGLNSVDAYQHYVMKVSPSGEVLWIETIGDPFIEPSMRPIGVFTEGPRMLVAPTGSPTMIVTSDGVESGAQTCVFGRRSTDGALRWEQGGSTLTVWDCTGASPVELFSWSASQAVIDQYSPPGLLDVDIKSVVVDDAEVYVHVTFLSSLPDSNREAGLWRLALDGSTVWATGFIGRNAPLPQGEMILTEDSVTVIDVEFMDWAAPVYDLSRATGQAELTRGRELGYPPVCGAEGASTLQVWLDTTSGCDSVGLTKYGVFNPGVWTFQTSIVGPPGVIYMTSRSDSWSGAVLRVRRTSAEWIPEALDSKFPVGKASEPTNEIKVLYQTPERIYYAGRIDRQASFGNARRIAAFTDDLFSAAVGNDVMRGVPGVPGRVRDLQVDRRGDRVLLDWRPPKKAPGVAVSDYVIQVSKGFHFSTIRDGRSTDTRLVLRSLDEKRDGRYLRYEVRVWAKNATVLSRAVTENVPR